MRFLAVLASAALLLAAGVAQAGISGAHTLTDKKNPSITGTTTVGNFGVTAASLHVACSTIDAVATMTAARKNQVDSKKASAQQKTDKNNASFPTLAIKLPANGSTYNSTLAGTEKAKMRVQVDSKGKGKMDVDVDLGKDGVNMALDPNDTQMTAYADATKNKACVGISTDKNFKRFKARLNGTST